MIQKTIINIKADKDVKKQAQKVAERLGVPLSTVVNSFLKQFIRTEELTLSTASLMTPELESVLKEIEKDRKTGKNISGPFTLSEAVGHLSKL